MNIPDDLRRGEAREIPLHEDQHRLVHAVSDLIESETFILAVERTDPEHGTYVEVLTRGTCPHGTVQALIDLTAAMAASQHLT